MIPHFNRIRIIDHALARASDNKHWNQWFAGYPHTREAVICELRRCHDNALARRNHEVRTRIMNRYAGGAR